ncbi:D-lactaldehyde dehydrogenase [Amanita rubescens]|nr:D-lactaldehyde dehydrogenase [Amanita rubescens]
MTVIAPGSKILVSGANGFIAVWLVRILLEQGYSVRGTVRSKEKGAFLEDMFKSYGDKFELVVVEDLTKVRSMLEGAFDEAVKGVDAIQHTASPFHWNADDPKEMIEPAVNGTVGILKSAANNALEVKRIIVLASTACIMRDAGNEPIVLNENDWNTSAIEACEKLGRNATPGHKYRASKTLAEKAAWAFYHENEKNVNWDLVVINPPFVFGPILHPCSSPSELNTSVKGWFDAVATPNSAGQFNEQLATGGGSYVDVRDLVAALIKSQSVPEASGERIIVNAGAFHWQDWIDVANSLSPPAAPGKTLPVGNPGAGRMAPHNLTYDTSKEKRILGLKYKTMHEVARDMLIDFHTRGW